MKGLKDSTTTGINKRRILLVFALLLTPWAIFISSSLQLFLINQNNLDNNIRVLAPFFGLMLAGFLVGLAIIVDSVKNKHYLIIPWLYFLAGPFFLLWNTASDPLHEIFNESLTFWILLGSWILIGFSIRNLSVIKAVPYFSFFAVLVISSDLILTAKYLLETSPPESIAVSDVEHQVGIDDHPNLADRPNIYHVVLDEYQSDIFELLLDDRLRSNLAGFTFFRNNRSRYGQTNLSMPSVFLGRELAVGNLAYEMQEAAFNSSESLLAILQRQGYESTAYLHQKFNFSPNLFDEVYFHKDFKVDHPWSAKAFTLLWFYSYWPNVITEYFLTPAVVEEIESGALSPDDFAVVSLDAFRQFLKAEPSASGTGRYVFVHMILPHPPYRLSEDCSIASFPSVRGQYLCANELIMDFVDELKRLKRYEQSMVFIHADHGSNLLVSGDSFHEGISDKSKREYHYLKSKALLLFKPFDTLANDELLISDSKSTLIDIAPTIAEGLGDFENSGFKGVSLNSELVESPVQSYFFGDGRGLDKYSISNGKLIYRENIPFKQDKQTHSVKSGSE